MAGCGFGQRNIFCQNSLGQPGEEGKRLTGALMLLILTDDYQIHHWSTYTCSVKSKMLKTFDPSSHLRMGKENVAHPLPIINEWPLIIS